MLTANHSDGNRKSLGITPPGTAPTHHHACRSVGNVAPAPLAERPAGEAGGQRVAGRLGCWSEAGGSAGQGAGTWRGLLHPHVATFAAVIRPLSKSLADVRRACPKNRNSHGTEQQQHQPQTYNVSQTARRAASVAAGMRTGPCQPRSPAYIVYMMPA